MVHEKSPLGKKQSPKLTYGQSHKQGEFTRLQNMFDDDDAPTLSPHASSLAIPIS